MFKEHGYVIWGTKCSCGRENFILQNKFHPWVESDFILKIKCSNCKNVLEIDRQIATQYYNQKIFCFFDDVEGVILDIGCGGGFLTQHLIDKKDVNQVLAVDIDNDCKEEIDKLKDKGKNVEFKLCDLSDISELFEGKSVDYVVNRDVFMFVENTKKYFDDISRIARRGIRQMGWFVSGNERMKNNLTPSEIVKELEKRDWNVELFALDWYKCGYFIKADR